MSSSSNSSSSSTSSDEEEDTHFRFPLRMRPTKKYKIAADTTLSKILTTIPSRPVPEFLGKEYIPPGESKQKLIFKCDEPNCTSAFPSKHALNSHQIWHRDRKLKCTFCNMTFKTKEDLTKHLNQFHPDLQKNPDANPLQCKKCEKISRDSKALWRHVRESHPGPPTPCTICGVLFKRVDNLKEHIKYKHPPPGGTSKSLLKCEICNKDFLYKSYLRQHIKKVHRGKADPIRCVLCHTSYGCRITYNSHMRRHIDPTFYPCEICNAKFPNVAKLKRHYKCKSHQALERKSGRKATQPNLVKPIKLYENKKRKLTENWNSKSFTSAELIELCRKSKAKVFLHRVDHDQVDQRLSQIISLASTSINKEARKHHNLECVYCHESQPDLDAVKKHEALCLIKRKSAKLNICPECNMEFDKPFLLLKHMRVHSDARPYQCSYCDQKFKWQKTKQDHEKRIHFGIPTRSNKNGVFRTFSCNYTGCQKKYHSAMSLHKHVASFHLKIRHTCKVCGKEFKGKDYLSVHMRFVHVNPALLFCRPCNRGYKTRLSMLLHVKTRRHRLKLREAGKEFVKQKKIRSKRFHTNAKPDET